MIGSLLTVLLGYAAFVMPANVDSLNSNPTNKPVVIDHIYITGNKITRPFIILRELPFKVGDTVDNNQLNKDLIHSKENLMNTYLFNFVTITASPSGNNDIKTNINIDVKEGWYTWPYPIFDLVDRNFNEWISSGASLHRINFGLTLEQHNVRGRNETASISYEGGFDQGYNFSYAFPYITSKQVHGLSFSVNYFLSHEIIYNTIANKPVRLTPHDNFLAKIFSGGVTYSYRPGIYTKQTVTLGYKMFSISDTVLKKNNNYFYNSENQQRFLSLRYTFRVDHRDYRPYALKGSIFDVEMVKQGFTLSFENVNMLFADITYHHYWPLVGPLYLSSGAEGIDVFYGARDYVSQTALGAEPNYIRGYEYYVIGGQRWIMWKNSLRIALLQNKIVKVKFIPTEKFNTIPNSVYFNINADGAYVQSNSVMNPEINKNTFVNIPLYSVGVGLDYLTYYGWLFRMEYSMNHTGNAGLYIHFTNPL